jgi:hypothetical protein
LPAAQSPKQTQNKKDQKILKRRSPKCQPNLCPAKAGHGQAKDDQDGQGCLTSQRRQPITGRAAGFRQKPHQDYQVFKKLLLFFSHLWLHVYKIKTIWFNYNQNYLAKIATLLPKSKIRNFWYQNYLFRSRIVTPETVPNPSAAASL